MFRKMFGDKQGLNGAGVSPGATGRTVDAIQKLGETEELLLKRQSLLEKKVAQETEKAKGFSKEKNKRAALMCLKKRKLYENQLEAVENNIMRVNEQQMMLENQRTTVETVAALSNAAKASKQTMHEMKIENVDKVLDEINDQTDQMEQIQQAMSAPIGAAADIDEDDLLSQLEEMEQEQLDEQLMAPAAVPSSRVPQAAQTDKMPQVPSGRAKVKQQKTQEELEYDELEALQAEMAL